MSRTFPETLRQLRLQKGLSQQALADKMIVTRPTVARWESGDRIPDALTIKRLAEILGVESSLLLSALEEKQERPTIILVDDRKIVLRGGIRVLEEALPEANIIGFSKGKEAIEYAKNNRVALAFLDIELQGMTGLDLCRDLLEINPNTNVIYLTAYNAYSLDAWGTGASGFMVKPITVEGVHEQMKHLRHPFLMGGIKA